MNDHIEFKTKKSLRIGFDGSCLANRRGFGRFSMGILHGLSATNPGHIIEVVADSQTCSSIVVPDNVQVREVPLSRKMAEAASAKGNRSFIEIWKLGRSIQSACYDVFYFPSSFTYVPVNGRMPVIVTMHDTLAVERPDLVFPTRRGRWFWWLKEQAARWTATRMTTVSETSRRDLARFFQLNEQDIGLLTEGVDEVFFRLDTELPKIEDVFYKYKIQKSVPYWLYVGGLSPHKNLLRMVEVFAKLPESIGQLVLVGDFRDSFHTHVPEIRAHASRHGVTNRIVFTGYVPDPELALLYRNAHAVVLPSLWEGFGLPAAEAMASGVPLLHSTAGSLPEVIGDAGLSFHPTDAHEMSQQWQRMANDDELRRTLASNGRKRAALYRWEKAGRLLWNEMEKLVEANAGKRRRAG